jgi:hypothetical protein
VVKIRGIDKKVGRARIILGRHNREFVFIKLVKRKDVVIREQTFIL